MELSSPLILQLPCKWFYVLVIFMLQHELHQSATDANDYSTLNPHLNHHWQRTCSSYICNYMALYCNIHTVCIFFTHPIVALNKFWINGMCNTHTASQVVPSISNEHTVSPFYPKNRSGTLWYAPTILHSVITQKTGIYIFTAVKAWTLICMAHLKQCLF
jgi:hypothetical protein